MKLKGTIVAIILILILIRGIPFRIGDQGFNFFNYIDPDILRIFDGFFGDIEDRLIKLSKGLPIPINPPICHSTSL